MNDSQFAALTPLTGESTCYFDSLHKGVKHFDSPPNPVKFTWLKKGVNLNRQILRQALDSLI